VKEPYDPGTAERVAAAHAQEFAALVRRHLDGRGDGTTVVAAYDAELFGHWWYEGPAWLEAVLRGLAASPRPSERPTTLSRALARRPPRRRLALPESSWGRGKGHAAWVDERTRWMWQSLRDAQRRFAALPPGPARDAAWRQLLLLSASDWPFLVATDTAAEYASERFRQHEARFDAACRGDSDGLAERDGTSPAPDLAALP
jgi:1,4-alpha-glucan branching enzyme